MRGCPRGGWFLRGIAEMQIDVCSREAAVRLAAEAAEKDSIISITSKEEPDEGLPENPNIVSVLHLKFNDLTEEYDEEGIPYGRPLPSQEDFAGLKEFADGLACERLIVHCWEGRSRSAAVAEALREYLGNRGIPCLKGGPFSPNPLVYTLACRELRRTAGKEACDGC